jgi:hypothetical protein
LGLELTIETLENMFGVWVGVWGNYDDNTGYGIKSRRMSWAQHVASMKYEYIRSACNISVVKAERMRPLRKSTIAK